MTTPSYASDPQIQFLSQLLEEIASGYLQVPRFQRPVVWTDEQRLELMRSILQGTPIGSILVWRTRQKVPSYSKLGPYRLKRQDQGEILSYILDGHQRLSTLFGALKSEEGMEPSNNPDEDICWDILYDLNDNDFLLESSRSKSDICASLSTLLDSVKSLRFQRDLIQQANAEDLVKRFESLAAAFQRYKIPVIPIVTDDLDHATRTFQRINSQGTGMSQVHMIHALTWSADFDLNSELEEIRNGRLAELGWQDIDDQIILTSCKAVLGLDLLTGDVDAISRAFRGRSEALHHAIDYMVRGIRFLADYCGTSSPKLLPYSVLLPLLAEGLRQVEDVNECMATTDSEEGNSVIEDLVRWYWWIIYVGFAGGTNFSRIRRAVESVRRVAREPGIAKTILKPANELAPFPRRYDFRNARAKVLALRMAEWKDQIAGRPDARKSLNQRGAEMVHPLILRGTAQSLSQLDDRLEALLRSPANRILASPEEAVSIRSRLQDGSLSVREQGAHLIPVTHLDDISDLLDQRRHRLEDLERTFLAKLGILDDFDQPS